MLKHLFPIAWLLFAATPAAAQLHASSTDEPFRLDGVLDESAWSRAEITTGFTQQEPEEGTPSTEKTEVRVLYDENNLYIGIMCYDSEPDKIVHKQMSRDGNHRYEDHIEMVIDTYNDKRMAYMFVTNPDGMMLDGTVSPLGGRGLSTSWDGIWDVRARITDEGWSCEFMIPFKTLRFPVNDVQVWGINFKRAIMRKLSFAPFNINNYYDMNNRLMSGSTSFQPFGLSTDAEDSFEIDIQRHFERYLADEPFLGASSSFPPANTTGGRRQRASGPAEAALCLSMASGRRAITMTATVRCTTRMSPSTRHASTPFKRGTRTTASTFSVASSSRRKPTAV